MLKQKGGLQDCINGGASQSHQHCVHPSTACLEATVAQTAVAAVADTAVIREPATAAAVAAEPGCPIPWISRHNSSSSSSSRL